MTSRTDVYAAFAIAVTTLIIGLTVLITGAFTMTKVGPVIAAGTALTTIGALGTLVTGYRAARHYATGKSDRATVTALAHAIVAHDADLARPQEAAKIVPISEAQARRQPRELNT